MQKKKYCNVCTVGSFDGVHKNALSFLFHYIDNDLLLTVMWIRIRTVRK